MILQPKKLPRIPLGQVNLLPESPGLYLVIDGANRVWYVGQASNLKERHQNHEHLPEFKKHKCTYVCPFIWEDSDDLDFWERENINHYQAPINENLHEAPILDLGYDSNQYLDRYAEIKMMISNLTTELEQLKPNLISVLEQQPEGKIKTEYTTAFITRRKVWQYSQEVENFKEQVKQLKKQEEENGTAVLIGHTIFPVVRNQKVIAQEVEVVKEIVKAPEIPVEIEIGYYHNGNQIVRLNQDAEAFVCYAWEHFEEGLLDEFFNGKSAYYFSECSSFSYFDLDVKARLMLGQHMISLLTDENSKYPAIIRDVTRNSLIGEMFLTALFATTLELIYCEIIDEYSGFVARDYLWEWWYDFSEGDFTGYEKKCPRHKKDKDKKRWGYLMSLFECAVFNIYNEDGKNVFRDYPYEINPAIKYGVQVQPKELKTS